MHFSMHVPPNNCTAMHVCGSGLYGLHYTISLPGKQKCTEGPHGDLYSAAHTSNTWLLLSTEGICTLLNTHRTHGYCSALRGFSIAAKELSLKCRIKLALMAKHFYDKRYIFIFVFDYFACMFYLCTTCISEAHKARRRSQSDTNRHTHTPLSIVMWVQRIE